MKKLLLLLILCAFNTSLWAQEKIISGILEDNGEVLIGANVAVFRNDILQHGVITDIDGKYTVGCEVGDRIEFSYTGFTTQSIIVTASMGSNSKNSHQRKIEKIKSKAFKDKMAQRRQKVTSAIKKNVGEGIQIAKLQNKYIFNQSFVDFDLSNGKVKLISPEQPLRYDLTISQSFGIQNVMPYHSYQLQNVYSQGRPIDGKPTFQDHNLGEVHSFGPKISDASNPDINAYDNNLLSSGLTIGTKVKFHAEKDNKKVYGIFNYERSPDIFDYYSNNFAELRVGIIDFNDNWSSANKWNVELNVNRLRVGNHNFTGYYQNVLKSMMVQSPSFDAQSGIKENAGFSPEFNHPNWLLNNYNNPVQSDAVSLFLNHHIKFSDQKNKLSNALMIEYKSIKIFENYNANTELVSNQLNVKTPSAKLISNLEVDICESSGLKLKIDNLATAAKAHFLSKKNQIEEYDRTDQLFRNTSTSKLEYNKNDLKLSLGLNSLIANNQSNDILSPNFHVSREFELYRKKIDAIQPYFNAQRLIKNFDLLLDRYNYSSLQINHHRSQDLRLDLPLWLPNDLDNEVKKEYKIGIKVKKDYRKSGFSTRLEYKYIEQQNVIFPILENNQWVLRNAADYSMYNISWFSEWNGWRELFDHRVNFKVSFEMSHFRTKVDKLYGSSEMIPIAGYANVSKNLIVDQPVGIIVGSDFNRNEQGDRIIADDGFPTKSNNLHIIADPTPLFNFAYAQEINIDKLTLNVHVDGQIGGKVWNGTQQTLDYYGVSQNSADNRAVTNYIFEGVDSNGEINDMEVAIADPILGLDGNRWARYGADGVASDYIRSASHIRLRSIELSYKLNEYPDRVSNISIYAKNLFTIASFRGFSTSHLYEDSISNGLQYFNQPIATEIGMTLTYKL